MWGTVGCYRAIRLWGAIGVIMVLEVLREGLWGAIGVVGYNRVL